MNIPLSLYIHVPWCIRKCPYCDFNSHAVRDSIPEQQYIAKLLLDLRTHQNDYQDRPIQSIFIGGGTPSLLSPTAYQQLFKGLRNNLQLSSETEITLEANPGASELERFFGFREAGINRLSLGVQSWRPEKLQALGRIHNDTQAEHAVKAAQAAGFTNLNIDIMHGLPQQTITEALLDLEKTIACQPTHISWYQLTVEPNTYFHRFPPTLPQEETLWEIQQQGQQRLQSAGFKQYEISAYCQENHHSRHNINYWQFGDYLGIGAGAHSKLTRQDGSVWRYWKVKHPRDYLRKTSVIEGSCQIPAKELLLEFLMNALRLPENTPLSFITERTGLSHEYIYQTLLSKAKLHGELLLFNRHSLSTTPLGRRFLNELLTVFIE